MGSPLSDHALVDRVGAACATLAFGVEMLVVAESGHAMPGIPILALLALPFALYAIVGIGRVWIEDQGVKLMNRGRTFVIAWEDIERFSLGRNGLLRRVGIAELYDGRRIGMWGIQGPNATTRRSDISADRLIVAMNAELERRRRSAAELGLERALVEPDETYLVASR